MKPEITHELKGHRPIGAQRGFAATFNWMLNFCRNLSGGPGVTVDRTDSDHPIIRIGDVKATAIAGRSPFACRFHVTEDDEDGKWEVYLPTGCLAVGQTCAPLNVPMSDVDGHADEDKWFLLALDESEGSPFQTRSETVTNAQGQEQTITVQIRRWEVIVHGKTSAKVDGVDTLQSAARRLMYVSAKRTRGSGESAQTAAEQAKNIWGDEFSQTVGLIYVETKPDISNPGKTITTRRYEAGVNSSISVAGRAAQNFDLVWYFEVDDETGELSVTHVYCVRNSTAVAGFMLTGPTMVEVTDAENSIWARISHNPNAGSVSTGENILSVEMDPSNTTGDDFTTWLRLYNVANNVVSSDYRASSLVNVQVFR